MKKQSEFYKIFPKLTKEEQDQNLYNSMSGMYDIANNTILMGSDAMDRYLGFQKEMIEKYSKK